MAGVFLLTGALSPAATIAMLCRITQGSHPDVCCAGPVEAVKQLGPQIAGVMGGKGGGRPGMYSGKVTQLELRREAEALLQTSADD